MNMAEVVDYSLKHQFLGRLQGSGGEHQLSDEQVEDDSQISVVNRKVNETFTFSMVQVIKRKRPRPCRQGGRSCAGARVAPAEKFGLGRKF